MRRLERAGRGRGAHYAKLLAYKDEYEVARMHADPTFARAIAAQFEGDYRIKFHLHRRCSPTATPRPAI